MLKQTTLLAHYEKLIKCVDISFPWFAEKRW